MSVVSDYGKPYHPQAIQRMIDATPCGKTTARRFSAFLFVGWRPIAGRRPAL
jgi:hypothetical protein